jgi:hypothetical protein
MFYETKIHLKTGLVPFREMVSMEKEQVVELMTNLVIDVNREELVKAGQLNPAQIAKMLQQVTEPIYMVNSKLYDLLVDNGIIS